MSIALVNVGHIDTGGEYRGVWGDGTYIYIANYTFGLRAYTFDGANFTLIDTIDDGGLGLDVWGDGTYIYLANNLDGLRAYTFDGVNFTNVGNISSGGQGFGVWGDGTYIYLANRSNGLRAYTFDGANFILLDTIDDGGEALDVWGDGSYIYLANFDDGLRAYTFDGASFVNVGHINDGDQGRDVWCYGSYIYLMNGAGGLRAYTFDGANFTGVGNIDDGGSARGGDGDGTYIYLANFDDGLRAYTFDGANFVNVGHIHDGGMVDGLGLDVWVDGSYIYLANYLDGLRAYMLSSSSSSSSSFSSSSFSSFSSSSFSSFSSSSLSSSGSISQSSSSFSSSSGAADIYPGDDTFDWSAVPDWFWWGPRVTMKFDIRSGNTPEPTVDHSVTLTGDSGDGSTYDGNVAWDGLGDFVNTGDTNTVVGEIYLGVGSKWRTRAHYKFDISAIPDDAAINHATLYLYFSHSYGDGVLDAAPDSSRVGRVTIDHMDDWGAVLPPSEFEETARLENIDILIDNDATPDGGRWVAVNVTTFIQEDVSVQHSPDTGCFRFRQSSELDYASCSASNLWMLASANDASHQPYIVVNYFVEGEDWADWEEAFDNEAFDHTLNRYVQHRFYTWVPHDVRESRDREKLPQFIYRHFVLKWWGKRFRYEYRYRDEFFPLGPTHIWGHTPIMWGQYRFANDSVISPTLYDELPVFEV